MDLFFSKIRSFIGNSERVFLIPPFQRNYTWSTVQCEELFDDIIASIKKQIVSDLADGTSKLTISQELFKDYYIDYIPYDEQKAFVLTKLKDYLKIQEKYRKAQEQLSQEIINLAK